MEGFFIIHPKQEPRKIDRDYAIFLHEWDVPPGSASPRPTTMLDFNLFTFNSRVWPGTGSMVAKKGDRVRIRLANLSMDSHPIHIHGHSFKVTGTDGGPIAPSAQWPETTVNVAPGTTRDIEFVADNPGDWAFHCHKSHHTMNQMGHDVPNLVGVPQGETAKKLRKILPGYMEMGESGMGEMAGMNMGGPRNWIPMMTGKGQFGPIEMGGMFTVVKIREGITSYEDPGNYKYPAGTVARKVPTPT